MVELEIGIASLRMKEILILFFYLLKWLKSWVEFRRQAREDYMSSSHPVATVWKQG